MKRVALAVSTLLLLGWIGFVGFLALTQRQDVVLSRPQLLAADLVITARVEMTEAPVEVESIHHVGPGVVSPDQKAMISVLNLHESQGGDGPGLYLLPLTVDPEHQAYRVTSIPRSPGYYGGPPRVYRATARAEAALRAILAAWTKTQ